MESVLGKVLLQARDAKAVVDSTVFFSKQGIKTKICRDAEKQFKSAIKHQPMIGTFLMLGKVNFSPKKTCFYTLVEY